IPVPDAVHVLAQNIFPVWLRRQPAGLAEEHLLFYLFRRKRGVAIDAYLAHRDLRPFLDRKLEIEPAGGLRLPRGHLHVSVPLLVVPGLDLVRAALYRGVRDIVLGKYEEALNEFFCAELAVA